MLGLPHPVLQRFREQPIFSAIEEWSPWETWGGSTRSPPTGSRAPPDAPAPSAPPAPGPPGRTCWASSWPHSDAAKGCVEHEYNLGLSDSIQKDEMLEVAQVASMALQGATVYE